MRKPGLSYSELEFNLQEVLKDHTTVLDGYAATVCGIDITESDNCDWGIRKLTSDSFELTYSNQAALVFDNNGQTSDSLLYMCKNRECVFLPELKTGQFCKCVITLSQVETDNFDTLYLVEYTENEIVYSRDRKTVLQYSLEIKYKSDLDDISRV